MSAGASEPVTDALVRLEKLLLPGLWVMDRMASRFNARGIGIVDDDFVSMHEVALPDVPPRHRGIATAEQLHELREYMSGARRALWRACWRGEWVRVAELTYEAIRWLDRFEQATDTMYPLARHNLESLGLGAVRAPKHERASGGKTRRLSKLFIISHLAILGWMRRIDEEAQPVFNRGVGILQNDVPYIPFVEEYRDLGQDRRGRA